MGTVNEGKRQAENSLKMFEIQQQLEAGESLQLLTPTRRFLREANVQELSDDRYQVQAKSHYFLFNDILSIYLYVFVFICCCYLLFLFVYFYCLYLLFIFCLYLLFYICCFQLLLAGSNLLPPEYILLRTKKIKNIRKKHPFYRVETVLPLGILQMQGLFFFFFFSSPHPMIVT